MAHELILHHYDFSSYSEKVRLVLGLKGLTWRSVGIPPFESINGRMMEGPGRAGRLRAH